jgi:hypothetical protein
MGKIDFKRVGRRAKNTFKRVGTIVRKAGGVVRGIIGTVDKLSGGMLSQAIQSDPRGMALMAGVNHLADKNKEIEDWERLKAMGPRMY